MTDRIAGAWGACSQCGARRRTSVPGTLCGPCNRRARNAVYVRNYAVRTKTRALVDRGVVLPPDTDPAMLREAEVEFTIAKSRAEQPMGHVMAPTEPDDGPGTFISWCYRCRGFLVGDPCETPPFYGRVYDTECPGKPPVRPSKRRDPMDEAAAYTSRAHEPLPLKLGGPPEVWGWEDTGASFSGQP